ncbi:hypothetical protein TcCL_ESM00523 [Trypanosoma cruzi]|uniref:Uncharacterized protein n=2 Tax=Trypanosoma cruzi TaxID=5693 RepID=Q4D398_TRYCC|nr:hypothetical protein, conserved [Trypanosoma cruzi]EAN86993.1 hypothetical protein, conserved [Trypanosoma cruzi]RNC61673.1 hypothetical protein TcCL_ESM00523 [Trypanosoma cruzi]|eukprot:XP_808844.1 hypothetical protein [Trypanosoma cruzi strain CL Brener]
MQNDLAQILKSIDWESIRGENETAPSGTPSMSPTVLNDGPLPHAEGNVSGNVEGVREGSSMTSTGISVQQQQIPTMPMGPTGGTYYINTPSYQAIGMPSAPARGQVQTQPMIIAQSGGQMMYMQMPYFQHTAYQHNPSPQQIYSTPQNPYYHPQFVQLPVEGQMMTQMPQIPQQQQYFQPSALHTIGVPATAFQQQQQQKQQQQQQQQQQQEVVDNQGGFVCLLPGSQLAQGTPFYYYGVRPTSHYVTTQAKDNFFDLPPYNNFLWQKNSQPADRSELAGKREGKGRSPRVPTCPVCGQSNFASESAFRSHMRRKHEDTGSALATEISMETSKNVTPAAAADEKDNAG